MALVTQARLVLSVWLCTGLALLAFLGAGQTHKEGQYKSQVKAGLYYLINQAKIDKNRPGNNARLPGNDKRPGNDIKRSGFNNKKTVSPGRNTKKQKNPNLRENM